MLRGAIASVLSKRLQDGELKIVEAIQSAGKTKEFAKSFAVLAPRLNALMIPAKENKLVYRASRNIPNVKSLAANSLNVRDLLQYKQIFIDKNALTEMK